LRHDALLDASAIAQWRVPDGMTAQRPNSRNGLADDVTGK
jgi:hypothetical protein